MPPFQIYGTTHWAALGFTAVLWLVMWLLVHWKRPWHRSLEITLAVILLSQWPVRLVLAWHLGYYNPATALPLHLCDVVSVLGGMALLTRRQTLIELTYFWGMAGTLNGLITPNLSFDFPHPEFFGFFALHSGVVIAALHMTIAWKRGPKIGGVWRAFCWIQVYLVVVGVFNILTHTNYGFFCARPENPSVLDALPAPPWHLLILEPLGLLLFFIFYLPFHRRSSQLKE